MKVAAEEIETHSEGALRGEVLGAASSTSSLERLAEKKPMWKALLQLRVLLPYLPRLLQLVNGTGGGGDSRELRAGVEEMQSGHRDLHRQVQDQHAGVQRLEEQVIRIRESAERSAASQAEFAELMRVNSAKLRSLAITCCVLTGVTVVLSAIMLILLLQR